MKLVGLTGGIASGKSTVAAILRRLGASIINADELSREVVQPEQDAWNDIIRSFGSDILQEENPESPVIIMKPVYKQENAEGNITESAIQ